MNRKHLLFLSLLFGGTSVKAEWYINQNPSQLVVISSMTAYLSVSTTPFVQQTTYVLNQDQLNRIKELMVIEVFRTISYMPASDFTVATSTALPKIPKDEVLKLRVMNRILGRFVDELFFPYRKITDFSQIQNPTFDTNVK